MKGAHVKESRSRILRKVFTSPFYLALAAVIAIAYYMFFYYIVSASNYGVYLVTLPQYLLYSLILSAAILLTLSVYAVSRSVHSRYAGAEGGALSIITSTFGAFVVGCNCTAPILASALYAIGFGGLAVGDTVAFLGAYQSWIALVLIAINALFIYYQLGRITRMGSARR